MIDYSAMQVASILLVFLDVLVFAASATPSLVTPLLYVLIRSLICLIHSVNQQPVVLAVPMHKNILC